MVTAKESIEALNNEDGCFMVSLLQTVFLSSSIIYEQPVRPSQCEGQSVNCPPAVKFMSKPRNIFQYLNLVPLPICGKYTHKPNLLRSDPYLLRILNVTLTSTVSLPKHMWIHVPWISKASQPNNRQQEEQSRQSSLL